MKATINIRPRRQVTLPKELLEELSLSVGDKIQIEVKNNQLVGKPIVDYTLNNIETIQNVLQDADISEDELQESGEKIRKDLVKEKYGK
jgi:antitoxin component of MazEF toxin-antitoxin module